MTAKYPKVEQDMWPLKLPAARAIIANKAADADSELFAEEARLSGASVLECAHATVAKGATFARLASAICGTRQALSAAVATAKTETDIAAEVAAAEAAIQSFAEKIGLAG